MDRTDTAIRRIPYCERGERMMRCSLTAIFAVVLLSACASKPAPEAEYSTFQPAVTNVADIPAAADRQAVVENVDLISVDLVNAMSQISGLHPSESVIHMDPPATHFGMALKSVLEQAGYALRIVMDDNSAPKLAHAVTKLAEQGNGIRNSYQLVVGDVRLKREYFEQEHGVTPSSNMYVIGADPTQITLNDQLFEVASVRRIAEPANPDATARATLAADSAAKELPAADAAGKANSAQIAADKTPPVAPSTPAPIAGSDLADKATPAATTAPAPALARNSQTPGNSSGAQTYPTRQPVAQIESTDPAGSLIRKKRSGVSQVKIKGNMYDLGRSNFSELLGDFGDMKKNVLIFGNDSLRLGRENKVALTEFIDGFEEESDVISVIGCSHGRTNLTNGNAVLATGRAQRVKEALMFAGVPEDRILEEGCWAPEHFDGSMPRRGVVITHKREGADHRIGTSAAFQ